MGSTPSRPDDFRNHADERRAGGRRHRELEPFGRVSQLTGICCNLRDDEQRSLARELHDSVGQVAVTANINPRL